MLGCDPSKGLSGCAPPTCAKLGGSGCAADPAALVTKLICGQVCKDGKKKKPAAAAPPAPPPVVVAPPPPPAPTPLPVPTFLCNPELKCRELLTFYANSKLKCFAELFLPIPCKPDCCKLPDRLVEAVRESRAKAVEFFRLAVEATGAQFCEEQIHALYLNPKVGFTFVAGTKNGRQTDQCCGPTWWAGFFYADFHCEAALFYGFWLIDDHCFPCNPCKPVKKRVCHKKKPQRKACHDDDAGGSQGSDSEAEEQAGLGFGGDEADDGAVATQAGSLPSPCRQRLFLVRTECPFWRVPFLEEAAGQSAGAADVCNTNECLQINILLNALECTARKKGLINVSIGFKRKCGKLFVRINAVADLPGKKKLVCVECS